MRQQRVWVAAAFGLAALAGAGPLFARPGRHQTTQPGRVVVSTAPAVTNGLKVGSDAIDFELNDMRGKPHKLSDFKGSGQLVLSFFCGCEDCRNFASTLAKSFKSAEKPPTFVAVMMPHWEPSATPSFARSTGTEKWNFLFARGKTGPGIVDQYKGSPCPRAYILNPDFEVAYVTPRPIAGRARVTATEVAKQLTSPTQ